MGSACVDLNEHALSIPSRWAVALAPAVIRQQMAHTSATMTARYTGEIPLDQIKAEFCSKFGNKIDVLENIGK